MLKIKLKNLAYKLSASFEKKMKPRLKAKAHKKKVLAKTTFTNMFTLVLGKVNSNAFFSES